MNLDCSGTYAQKRAADDGIATVAPQGIVTAAYPNPFKTEVTLAFSVPVSEKTRAEIIASDGRKVATLFDGVADAGRNYLLIFDGTTFSNGLYIYRVVTEDGNIQNTKLMLNK